MQQCGPGERPEDRTCSIASTGTTNSGISCDLAPSQALLEITNGVYKSATECEDAANEYQKVTSKVERYFYIRVQVSSKFKLMEETLQKINTTIAPVEPFLEQIPVYGKAITAIVTAMDKLMQMFRSCQLKKDLNRANNLNLVYDGVEGSASKGKYYALQVHEEDGDAMSTSRQN